MENIHLANRGGQIIVVDKDEFKDLSKIMTSNEINDFVNTLNKIVMDGAELCVLTNKMASIVRQVRQIDSTFG